MPGVFELATHGSSLGRLSCACIEQHFILRYPPCLYDLYRFLTVA